MTTATVTSKGQVTIPKKVRDALHLATGDTIEFVVRGKGKVILRPISKKIDEVFSKLYQPKRQPVTPEEMNESICQRMRWVNSEGG